MFTCIYTYIYTCMCVYLYVKAYMPLIEVAMVYLSFSCLPDPQGMRVSRSTQIQNCCLRKDSKVDSSANLVEEPRCPSATYTQAAGHQIFDPYAAGNAF